MQQAANEWTNPFAFDREQNRHGKEGPDMAIPRKDTELVPYSTNFDTRITAAPADYGLTAAQATQYGTLHDAYLAAYNAMAAAREAGTRSESLTATKDSTKLALLRYARELYRYVQANNTVPDAKKIELGVRVVDTEPTPVPPPGSAPALSVVSVTGRRVRLRLKDSTDPERKGRPLGTLGAQIFSFVGDEVPTTTEQWRSEGITGLTMIDVVFPDNVANGATVWFTAVWFNGSKQTGPNANPISTNLQGGAALAA
jgi:hypothetical protein